MKDRVKKYIDQNLFKNGHNLKTIIYDLHDYDGINNLFINKTLCI